MLAILVLVLLSSSLIGGKVFGSGDNILLWPPFNVDRPANWSGPSNFLLSDPVLAFNPELMLTRSDLSRGIAPLWNPYAGGGRPEFGSVQAAPLYPITWLAFLLPFWSSLGWIAAAKLLIAAAGTFLFARALALRRGPALLAAIVFAFGTFFVDWLEHPHTNVWAMLPWMLLAVRRVSTRGSLGATALLGLTVALAWFGDHPESAALTIATAAAYGAFELLAERFRGPVELPRRWPGPSWTASLSARSGLLVLGLVLGLGVSAVSNLPFLELVRQTGSVRRGSPAFSLSSAWAFFFPGQWGLPNKAASFLGPATDYNERTAYLGVLPLLLAVGSIGRRRPREQWFFVALGAITFATIFDVPLWASGVRDLPDAGMVALGRLLIVLTFASAVLAAYGLQRWCDGSVRERRQMLWIMSAVAALPGLVWLGAHPSHLSKLPSALVQVPVLSHGERSSQVWALASVVRWIAFAALALLALRLARRRAPLVGLVIALTAIDLLTLDRGYHGSIPASQATPPVPAAIRYLQTHEGASRVIGSESTMPANLAERFGLRDVRVGVVVLFPRRYEQLWLALGGVNQGEQIYDSGLPNAHRLADLFAARYVMIGPREPIPPWLHPAFRNGVTTIAVNATALPRAWVAYDWRGARGRSDALAATLASSTAALHRTPVIEGVGAAIHAAAPAPTTARLLRDSTNSVDVEADALRPGYLILDDSAYPGWQASVDGHPVPWHPANEDFRAVAIPAGRHVVSFRYRPGWVLPGIVVSSVSLLGLFALGIGAVLTRRRAR